MKRLAGIMLLCALVTGTAFAKDFTNLIPPSMAVVDFEVSMPSESNNGQIVATNSYYGQLISQALLSVLVQQNGNNNANLVGKKLETNPNVPLYTPGQRVTTPSPIKPSVTGTGRFVAPILRIFDKKYIEKALLGANYTVNDLYTKAAGAFNFADLDFVVLGNVYNTKYQVGNEMWDCIGFNVRVLNTARAEELFSYTAIVRSDLADLQDACTSIARMLMQDVLSRYCAQFMVTNTTETKADGFRLFWQPQQGLKDDNTLITTDDSWKKEISLDQYYWVLPGTYQISVYSNDSQLLQNVGGSLVLKPGDIQKVQVVNANLAPMKGSLTIKVPANETIRVRITENKTLNQNYWWEIGNKPKPPKEFTVSFPEKDLKRESTLKSEYLTLTNELVIPDLPVGRYTVSIIKQPNEDLASVLGWRRIITSKTINYEDQPIEIKTGTPARLDLAKMTIQPKTAGVYKTRVSFVFNPGFFTSLYLGISGDKNLYWLDDCEKVVVDVEYSQDEWNAQPTVAYTFISRLPIDDETGLFFTKNFNKADLDPNQDTVVVVDWRALAKAQKIKREASKPKPVPVPEPVITPVPAAATTTAPSAKATTTANTPAATATPTPTPSPAQPVPTAKPAPVATPKQSKTKMSIGIGIGTAIQSSYTQPTSGSSTTLPEAATQIGLDYNGSTSLHFFTGQSFGIGVGGMVHGLPAGSSGTYSQLGGAVSGNLIFGNPLTGAALTWVEFGYGTGVYAGLGFAMPLKAGKKSQSVIHFGALFNEISEANSLIYNYENYPAVQTSIQASFGVLF